MSSLQLPNIVTLLLRLISLYRLFYFQYLIDLLSPSADIGAKIIPLSHAYAPYLLTSDASTAVGSDTYSQLSRHLWKYKEATNSYSLLLLISVYVYIYEMRLMLQIQNRRDYLHCQAINSSRVQMILSRMASLLASCCA